MDELKHDFPEIAQIITKAREDAFQRVNEALILMYKEIGKYLSAQSETAAYGDAYVDSLSNYIQQEFPGIKGFTRRGLYRMKQFYEAYKDNEIVSTLLTQLSWSNHLTILSSCKSNEEREFYIRLSIRERYTNRQLKRQIESSYYERYMLSKSVLAPEPVAGIKAPFMDNYVMEFLSLPDRFHENDLRKALIGEMKKFILELGQDFTFIDEEYPIIVGGEDYHIDLLFYHRALRCLVAIELKVGKFKPEYVSKMDFYLEGLDRQIRKEDENPSVGLILCSDKNEEVVEYAMSRTMSPMLVSQYQLTLPDKALLQKKLQEISVITTELMENEQYIEEDHI
jgi:predicted nuclease of restriction endonuclease-like (RecB) superfamily